MNLNRCFIMLCNMQTEQGCLDRNLFGDKAKRLDSLNKAIENGQWIIDNDGLLP